MATDVVEAQQDRPPGSGAARRRGAGLRALLFAVTALVAGSAGVGGTLLYQRGDAPDTSAVDGQAADVAEALRQDLNAGFYSGGGTYGGQFTEGTIVAQVEAHGGAVLSSGTAKGEPGSLSVHTATVMLGLVPPGKETVAADAYPVRCYRYTFSLGSHSVEQSPMTCPATRADGTPGSLAAQLGVLLSQQPTGTNAYRAMSTSGYPHTPQGATDFLKDKGLVAAGDTVDKVSGKADGDDVYVVALRINGACHYLRMDSSSSASRLIPLWAAPADEQKACAVQQAVSAAALYGIDPAKAG
ncbi:hypothetical protein [Streptomyces sp. NBC_00038]|uniref:hypothetical protein n=1 Tax=Streptomyces sp. NBC_00038 TaxID=2903615 RepID=UPI00224FFF6B|nr:hypothetical protein [Streptomyces sp. NBC_00038]MCX5558490.1 hypothetical protein [Streptomyces sp. NBC_00038]